LLGVNDDWNRQSNTVIGMSRRRRLSPPIETASATRRPMIYHFHLSNRHILFSTAVVGVLFLIANIVVFYIYRDRNDPDIVPVSNA
jgi:hypothetical protein